MKHLAVLWFVLTASEACAGAPAWANSAGIRLVPIEPGSFLMGRRRVSGRRTRR